MKRETLRLFAVITVMVIMNISPLLKAKTKLTLEKGKYEGWNDDLIDNLEIVQPFHISEYQKVILIPLKTEKVTLPKSNDNTYEPTRKVLSEVSDIFAEGFKETISNQLQIIAGHPPSKEEASGVLIIKGDVTDFDPGSKAKRFWVGFGSGRTRVEISGTIEDGSTGNVLLKFAHGRTSPSKLDYEKALRDDSKEIGEDIGKMISCFK